MSEKRRKRRQGGNGSIDRAANGTWKIRWCEAGKRKTRGGLRSRDDAERVLAKVLGDMAQGRSGLPADPASTPKLSELAPDYFERRKRTHRAGFEDASRWRKHAAPYFEHLRPAQVDAARIRAFIEAKLVQKANPATVRIYVALGASASRMGTMRLSLSFSGPVTDSRRWMRRDSRSTCCQRSANTSPVRKPARAPIAHATFNGSGSARKMRRTAASFSMEGVARASCVERMRRIGERGG